MRMILAALMALVLSGPALADGIEVKDAFARPTTANAPTGAVYLTLVNTGTADDRLIAVETAVATEATLHSSAMTADGMMQMLPLESGVVIPAQGEHVFAPGADHVMLMGLSQPLIEGARFTLTLTFEAAGKMVVVVPVSEEGVADPHAGHSMAPASE